MKEEGMRRLSGEEEGLGGVKVWSGGGKSVILGRGERKKVKEGINAGGEETGLLKKKPGLTSTHGPEKRSRKKKRNRKPRHQ